MVQFYKIIKYTIAVITTINMIALKPTKLIHMTKKQCRNNATTHKQPQISQHSTWNTVQKENATNHINKRHFELFRSNAKTKQQTTKTAPMAIAHNKPIKE